MYFGVCKTLSCFRGKIIEGYPCHLCVNITWATIIMWCSIVLSVIVSSWKVDTTETMLFFRPWVHSSCLSGKRKDDTVLFRNKILIKHKFGDTSSPLNQKKLFGTMFVSVFLLPGVSSITIMLHRFMAACGKSVGIQLLVISIMINGVIIIFFYFLANS